MGSLVSLVMSDIVDSTRRWNAAEGAMAADLELHDRLIRGVVEGAGGSVFKHTGDGMIAVFDDPVAAAGAAAGIQQAIGDAQWQHTDGLQVRAAVHSGVVYPRDGDLFGTAVNRVARLLGVCPPGAVLVSGATAGLLTDRAPEGLSLRPIGPVPLAGFATPDDAHALVGSGLAPVASPAAEPVLQRAEIPSIDDELVGRTDEVAAIWEALSRARLVTLAGVGGMGKTRLALEVAVGAVAAYNGAVWWIDLANATADDAVVAVAMAAVGARENPGRTALQAVGDRLSSVRGLVVVDNCEHVLRAARELVGAVRSAAPEMRVICTSREALGLRGEQIIAIGSLLADDGVTLFRERALAVRADLDVDANTAVIERICTRLDGIPLAIELAAARCRSMNPVEIDELLGDRFRLLRGGRESAERHRTLQAAVAWSYSLLDPDERSVFDQMAVFAGGSLIDGVVAVTGFDRFDALDIVDRLVARSMVVATDTPLGTRYHQLETLRQYAEDRLVDAGTIGDVRDRHLSWMHALAIEIGSSLGTPRSGSAFRRFATEVDNLRVAVAHATGTARHHLAHDMVSATGLHLIFLPAWEMFDRVRPIEVPDGWTDAAAYCAVAGAYIDFTRSGQVDPTYPIGGIPEHFLETNPRIAALQALNLARVGEVRRAVEVLTGPPGSGIVRQVATATQRIWIELLYTSELGVPMARIEQVLAEGDQILAAINRTGDEVMIAYVSNLFCMAFRSHRPEMAVELGRKGLDLLEGLGARYGAEMARVTLVGVLAEMSRGSTSDAGAVAEWIRREIESSVERRSGFLVLANLRPAAEVLVTFDPPTAYLCAALYEHNLGVPVPPELFEQLRGHPEVARLEADNRIGEMSIDELAHRALAALDRLIAQQSGGGG